MTPARTMDDTPPDDKMQHWEVFQRRTGSYDGTAVIVHTFRCAPIVLGAHVILMPWHGTETFYHGCGWGCSHGRTVSRRRHAPVWP